MVFVFFWVLCAVASALIGARKDAAVSGFFLGLFFGPFGILFAALIRGDKVPCYFCKELMHMAASVCPHCQREKPAASDTGEAVTETPGSGIVGGLMLALAGVMIFGAIVAFNRSDHLWILLAMLACCFLIYGWMKMARGSRANPLEQK